MLNHLFNTPRKICQNETGTMTMMGLFLTLIGFTLGGLAIDINQLVSAQTKLQSAADSAAHAALYHREKNDSDSSKLMAVTMANGMLAKASQDIAITVDDIQFGVWDRATQTFTLDELSKTAVRVKAIRSTKRGNPLSNTLMQIIGYDTFDLTKETVFTTYRQACMREGFVSDGVVEIRSNNTFTNGFCLHSNSYVSVNQNNVFEEGTIVSMPDISDLDLPNSGFEKNDGLETALREGKYRIRILNQMDYIINSLLNGEPEFAPKDEYGNSYITDGWYETNAKKVNPSKLLQNRVNVIYCNNRTTLEAGVYREMVIVTDCEIKFNNGVVLEDTVLATTNTDIKSVSGPDGLTLGRNDNCAPGGGAVLMTKGGFDIAANLQVYGGQIVAQGPIQFSANADGIEGASMISGVSVSGTSNMSMGFCSGNGMDTAIEVDYYRMAL